MQIRGEGGRRAPAPETNGNETAETNHNAAQAHKSDMLAVLVVKTGEAFPKTALPTEHDDNDDNINMFGRRSTPFTHVHTENISRSGDASLRHFDIVSIVSDPRQAKRTE